MISNIRATLSCCTWLVAPVCWLDNLCGCRWRRICDLHDWFMIH